MIQFRDEGNQTEYLYRVSSETLPPVHYETTQGKAYLVQVEVRWWQSDGGTQPTRRGYGKLYVKRNRVVYAQAQP
jgi:hypothetical protein